MRLRLPAAETAGDGQLLLTDSREKYPGPEALTVGSPRRSSNGLSTSCLSN
jgi:hypothetical protein